jgi:hypothetical protein
MTVELVLAVAAGALAQTTAGFGLALICGPVLIASQPAGHGLRLVLTVSLLANALVLAGRPREAKVSAALWLAVPAVVATPAVVWGVHQLDHRALSVAAGLVTLACAAALAVRLRLRWLHGRLGAIVASLVSEVGNAIGGLSGPAVALYAVNADWPPISIAPTLQVFGLVTNVVTLAATGGPLLTVPAAIALACGWLTGSLVSRRLDPGWLRTIVLVLAGAGGAYAVARGAWS